MESWMAIVCQDPKTYTPYQHAPIPFSSGWEEALGGGI